MVDNRTPESRSALMSRIRGKNTSPELIVRRTLHRLGYRFRLHRSDLPGTPDIVLPGRQKVIFVHGCFWHAHGCSIGKPPKSRTEFWVPKLLRNRQRDQENEVALIDLGWQVAVILQCEIKDLTALEQRLISFVETGTESDRHRRELPLGSKSHGI